MKTKAVPLIFIFVALFLVFFFFYSRRFIHPSEKTITRAKVITTAAAKKSGQENVKVPATSENEKYETFVPLLPGETLIGALTVDLNNDGYDDEVIVVRKSTSNFLWVIPGIFNANTHEYDRFDEIQTKFTRTRTFSFSAMDIIGDHYNSIIYQGVDDDGNYVMQIFNCKKNPLGQPAVVNIGSFSSDGTVFIQQTERSENYELGISRGESFSVWVYSSEQLSAEEEKSNKAVDSNQIQQEYRWNPFLEHYELVQQIKVTASHLMAKELSRILDGTEESFATFLNGLWYKTSNTDGKIRYLYFDYKNKEIIHLFDDSQEVYQWDNSKLRHNGIYLTTVNSDILTLHRRFDISLIKADEIKLTIRDDINLPIKESTMWDGNYKKLSLQNSFEASKKTSAADSLIKEIKNAKAWLTADSEIAFTFNDYNYLLKDNAAINAEQTGVYSVLQTGNDVIIQFRPDSETSYLNDYYAASFGTKKITETVKKKTVEKKITDYDSLILTPVKITPTDSFPSEGRSFQLTRGN